MFPHQVFSPLRLLLAALCLLSGAAVGWALASMRPSPARQVPEPGSAPSFPATGSADTNQFRDVKGRLSRIPLSGTGDLELTRTLVNWARQSPDDALRFLLGTSGDVRLAEARQVVFEVLLAQGRGEQLRTSIDAVASPVERQRCRTQLLAALTTSDPAAAFAFAQEHTLLREPRQISALFSTWATRDPAAASARLEELDTRSQQTEAVASLSRAWARLHPDDALRWSQSLKRPEWRSTAVVMVHAGLAAQDPLAAATLALQQPPEVRAECLAQVASVWARTDPKAALAWVQQQPPAVGRDNLLAAIGNAVSAASPETAQQLLHLMAVGTAESDLTVNTLRTWSRHDPESAFAWASQLPPARGKDAVHALLFQLGESDPATAARILTRPNFPASVGEQARHIGAGYAEADPTTALNWVRELRPELQTEAMKGVLLATAKDQPTLAVEALRSLPASAQPELAAALVEGWAATDPSAAIAWVQSLTGAPATHAASQLATVLARQNPEAAAERLTELTRQFSGTPPSGLPAGYSNPASAAALDLAAAWNPGAYPRALDWATALPPGEVRGAALEGVLGRWATTQPESLAEHLHNLPTGPERNQGAAVLSHSLARADIGAACAWAAAISVPTERQAAVRELYNIARDKDQAAAALITSGLVTSDTLNSLVAP